MIRDFFLTRKTVVRSKFIGSVVTSLILWTIYLIIFNFKNENSKVATGIIVIGYLSAITVMPFVFYLITIPSDFLEFSRVRRILNKAPISELYRLGLDKSYSAFNAMPVLIGSIYRYPITCEIEKGTVRVIAKTDLDLVEESHWKKLASVFGEKRIQYDDGIALVFKKSKWQDLSALEFETEIRTFVSFLWQEKLTPWLEDEDSHD